MKKAIIWLSVFGFLFGLQALLFAGGAEKPKDAPLNPEFLDFLDAKRKGELKLRSDDGFPLGDIPLPFDMSRIRPSSTKRVNETYSTVYDLRNQNKLTSVKDQADCGACWTFGTYASLESCLMPSEQKDYSEQNMNAHHGFDNPECEGGNTQIATAYLARWDGPISESDDPYPYTRLPREGFTIRKHVQQVIELPERTSSLDNDTAKYFIRNFGALKASIFYTAGYYNSSTYGFYNNGYTSTNHAISLVGWDDSFSASNFPDTPAGNGAFIARNSWGTDWGESGYFYISYYDTSLSSFACFNNAESTGNYDSVYQYDPLGATVSSGYGGSYTAWGANIFTATKNESLGAVGFYSTDSDMNYEIYVYTGVSDNEPGSGTLQATKTGTHAYPGYYTVQLDSAVSLTGGQKFSVVIKFVNNSYEYPISLERPIDDYSSAAAANLGESFMDSDGSGSWYDTASGSANRNVCIKAFTGSGTSVTPTITITAPNGGESWEAKSSQTITWRSTGTVGNVRIQYSTNNGSTWSNVVSSTANDGTYGWTVPDVSSAQCLVKISEASDGSPSDESNVVFTIASDEPSVIALNRTDLYFCCVLGGSLPGSQRLIIANSGNGLLNWSVSGFVGSTCTPSGGTGDAIVTVAFDPAGLSVGSYNGTLTFSCANASNSPQTVTVHVDVINSSGDQSPIGAFSTPENGSTAMSSIAVTGWAVDDTGVESVKIYRGDANNYAYIGDAVFVEGARPDIEAAYSTYPGSYQAGWGYMLLTNFLPNGGNGTFQLHAVAADAAGHQVLLGSKTITCDNANAVKPFGAIDTPAQGGSASGGSFSNVGWVLTPMPNQVPTNGSTIDVYVDGVLLGTAAYNIYREDIATYFPGYANSSGACAKYTLDTTGYGTGVHQIFWIATDSGGNADGIGSRFFTVQNSAGSREGRISAIIKDVSHPGGSGMMHSADAAPCPDARGPVAVRKGYGNASWQDLNAGQKGIVTVETHELGRFVLDLNADGEGNRFSGYMVVNGVFRALPAGSTLDMEKGIFYWQPGPGFIGTYDLVFFQTDKSGTLSKRSVSVNIFPGSR
ncbi:MAG: hypothetical protein GY765_27170 [bacterium]|nr:hypothetical protein [bacterium]